MSTILIGSTISRTNYTRIKSLTMHSASIWPHPIPNVVGLPRLVPTMQTSHAPGILPSTLPTKSGCVSTGGSTSIPVGPSGATVNNNMHPSASIAPSLTRIHDRRQPEGRNDQPQHGSVTEPDELLHDLQSSLIAAASEYRPPPSPLQADDGWSNDGRGKDGPSPIGNEIREREDVLERLRRDLDRLLQSPKVA